MTAMELEGRTAIVTGAGRGVGRAIALELASLGADVVIAEILEANAANVVEEVRALGRRAISVKVDVTSREDLDTMANRSVSEFGRIDILVNNAGVFWSGTVLDVTEESWDSVMDVNAKGVFFASQAVLPHMMAAKRGNIISLASIAGKVGSATSLAYCASKAAVISITRSLPSSARRTVSVPTASVRASSTRPRCGSRWRLALRGRPARPWNRRTPRGWQGSHSDAGRSRMMWPN